MTPYGKGDVEMAGEEPVSRRFPAPPPRQRGKLGLIILAFAVLALAAGIYVGIRERSVAEVKPALERALRAVRDEKRSAVIDAHIR